MDYLRPAPSSVILTCFSGPDQGKRLVFKATESTLGRSAQCDLLSDDQDVVDRHVLFHLRGERPLCRTVGEAPMFVDGHRMQEVEIVPGQQLRIGRSLWRLGAATTISTAWPSQSQASSGTMPPMNAWMNVAKAMIQISASVNVASQGTLCRQESAGRT